MKTPRQLVSAAFNAIGTQQYHELASMCDPLSLKSFKQEMLDEYCPVIPDATDQSSYRPIELTDEQYREMIEFLDPLERLKEDLGSSTTIDELIAMDPVTLFGAWLYAHSAERFSDEPLRMPWERKFGWTPEDIGRVRSPEPRYETIGCVFDTLDVAHVVYRLKLSAMEAIPEGYRDWFEGAAPAYRDFMTAMHHRGDPSVVSCLRQGDRSWRLVAKKHFMGFGAISISIASDGDENSV